MNKKTYKLVLFFLVVGVLVGAYQFGWLHYLEFDYLKNNLARAQQLFLEQPFFVSAIYFVIYVLVAALSIPGAAILTIFGGALFGVIYGVIIVSFASTLGATLSFLMTRFLFKDFVSKRFHSQISVINKNIQRDGASYLFSLRLIPIFPFFLVNIAMGLTSMPALTYWFVSQMGMLPATIAFVYAGNKVSELTSGAKILGPEMLGILVLLGLLPYLLKKLASAYRDRRLYKKFVKPKKFDFNMIVIGAGAGGLVSAFIANVLKAKVALVEKNKMGGDCLNYGCVPSKALIKSSKVIHLMKKAEVFGIKPVDLQFDFLDIMARARRVIETIGPHDSAERYRRLGVQCFNSEAKIISPYEVKIGETIYSTQFITVATGSSPSIPPIKGIESANFVTSDTIWDLKVLPKKFLILGGGPIGCELAQCFSRFGSEVTMLERSERLLIREDLDVSVFVKETLSTEGIKIFLKHTVLEFCDDQNKKLVICQGDEGIIKVEYDVVLIALGRNANSKGFGLEELGVSLRDNGTIETDEYLRATYPNIFACGDVAGPYQFTHTASHQAWYCAVNALLGKFKKFKVDYEVIPWCIFLDPEVATVGINEEAAKKNKLDYEVTLFHLSDLDRAIADDETKGFVKIITQKGSDKILGATIVGTQASTMILEFISAMKFKKGLNHILKTVHIYPSVGEANKYAAGAWKEKHAPQMALKLLGKYFKWSRNQ